MRIAPSIAVLATVLTLAVVSPAAATDGFVEVSTDGVTYSSAAPSALFGTSFVPGQTMARTFYVRNASTHRGSLRISLYDMSSPDIDVTGALTIATSTPGHPGVPVGLSGENACKVVLDGEVISAGETVKVTTDVALGDLEGGAGQGATASLAYRVVLFDAAEPQLPPEDCNDPATQVPLFPPAVQPPTTAAPTTLAGTGAAPLPVIAVSAGLLGAGLFFLTAARRRRAADRA